MKRYLFFVSTGRTGTHFLTHLFDQYIPNTIAFHEPKPAFKRRGYELVNRPYSVYEKYYFKTFRMARCLGVHADVYVEANNCLFSSIPLIRDAFSPSTIVHIIRDGRDVVRSYMNSLKRYAKDPRANKQLSPSHFAKDAYSEQWDGMNPIEKTAWFWLRVNEVIEPLPDVDVPGSTLERAFQDKKHSASLNYIPEWDDWPTIWKQQFSTICGEKMQKYGYTIE